MSPQPPWITSRVVTKGTGCDPLNGSERAPAWGENDEIDRWPQGVDAVAPTSRRCTRLGDGRSELDLLHLDCDDNRSRFLLDQVDDSSVGLPGLHGHYPDHRDRRQRVYLDRRSLRGGCGRH